MAKETLHLSTPGEILLEEFIRPLGLTQKEVADTLGISQSYISRLEKRIISRLKVELEKVS